MDMDIEVLVPASVFHYCLLLSYTDLTFNFWMRFCNSTFTDFFCWISSHSLPASLVRSAWAEKQTHLCDQM